MDRKKLLLGLLAVLAIIYVASQLSPGHQVSHPQSPIVKPGQSVGQHPILGQPTVSAVFIDRTLCAAKSPACGTGTALYTYGKQSQIDPAYALAFFWHESQFGKLGIAHVNKGLGNIRCSAGYQCRNGFRAYATWAEGYLDWYRLITWYVTDLHKRTIEQIVPTYAPSVENDTPAYINAVLSSVATWHKEGTA